MVGQSPLTGTIALVSSRTSAAKRSGIGCGVLALFLHCGPGAANASMPCSSCPIMRHGLASRSAALKEDGFPIPWMIWCEASRPWRAILLPFVQAVAMLYATPIPLGCGDINAETNVSDGWRSLVSRKWFPYRLRSLSMHAQSDFCCFGKASLSNLAQPRRHSCALGSTVLAKRADWHACMFRAVELAVENGSIPKDSKLEQRLVDVRKRIVLQCERSYLDIKLY